MEWYMVDDKDITASTGEFVFRLRKELEKTKDKYDEVIFVDMMKLQVRKKQNVEFRDLGYKFLVEDKLYVKKADYVDSKVWTDIDDISDRADEILFSLEYIESSSYEQTPNKNSKPDILRAAAKGFIKAFKKREFLIALNDYEEDALENMILHALKYWEVKEPFEDETTGIEREIRLKELQLELTTIITEPSVMSLENWSGIIKSHNHLHDEEWLNKFLEKEKSYKTWYYHEASRKASFKTEFFIVKDIELFESLMEKARLDYWYSDSGKYMFGSTSHDFDSFLGLYEDWTDGGDFIKDLQAVLTDYSIVTIYSSSLFKPAKELEQVWGPIGIFSEFFIITNDEDHKVTLEKAAENKLNGLRRKWGKYKSKIHNPIDTLDIEKEHLTNETESHATNNVNITEIEVNDSDLEKDLDELHQIKASPDTLNALVKWYEDGNVQTIIPRPLHYGVLVLDENEEALFDRNDEIVRFIWFRSNEMHAGFEFNLETGELQNIRTIEVLEPSEEVYKPFFKITSIYSAIMAFIIANVTNDQAVKVEHNGDQRIYYLDHKDVELKIMSPEDSVKGQMMHHLTYGKHA